MATANSARWIHYAVFQPHANPSIFAGSLPIFLITQPSWRERSFEKFKVCLFVFKLLNVIDLIAPSAFINSLRKL